VSENFCRSRFARLRDLLRRCTKRSGSSPEAAAVGGKRNSTAHGWHHLFVCMYVCMYVYITINTYISQADFLPKQRQSLDNREKIKRGTKEKLVE
jgi:hypothetical protein